MLASPHSPFFNTYGLSLSSFFKISLFWSFKSSIFCPDFHHPLHISSLCMIAFKVTVIEIFVVLSSPLLPLVSLSYIGTLVFVYLKLEQPAFVECRSCSPMLAIKGAPGDHDTQIMDLSPTLIWIWIWICHLSGVVYCNNTRLQSWLLSVIRSHIWPGTFKRNMTQNK